MKGEFELIELIKKKLPPPSSNIITGIGDDTAVTLPPEGNLVSTVDMMVEKTHFDLSYTKPEELGYKALAVNLSDIAAMGATPKYCLVSLGIRPRIDEQFISQFFDGFLEVAQEFSTEIIGGNIAKCQHHLIIDVTVLGSVEETGLLRSGAKPGDKVALSGHLGLAEAGRQCLEKYGMRPPEIFNELVRAHLKPLPRIREALALKKTNAITSMIDVSDGLSSELHHLSKMSKVHILLDGSYQPIPLLRKAAETLKKDPWEWVLHGGENYELLMTLKPEGFEQATEILKQHGTTLIEIGTVDSIGQGVDIVESDGVYPLEPRGWDHFEPVT